MYLFDSHDETLNAQMGCRDRFQEILGPRDFVKNSTKWRSTYKLPGQKEDFKLAPEFEEVLSGTQRQWHMKLSNTISLWIGSEVLKSPDDSSRRKMLSKFINWVICRIFLS